MADRKPTKPGEEPMTYRKDDHITSEGPTESYHQKITRESNDGTKSEVTYFNTLGQEIPEPPELGQIPGNPLTEGKHPIGGKDPFDPKHSPEHKR